MIRCRGLCTAGWFPILTKGEVKDRLLELVGIAGKKDWSLTLHDIHSVLPEDKLSDVMLDEVIQLIRAMEIEVQL